MHWQCCKDKPPEMWNQKDGRGVPFLPCHGWEEFGLSSPILMQQLLEGGLEKEEGSMEKLSWQPIVQLPEPICELIRERINVHGRGNLCQSGWGG
jgi:hypothetical protein